MIDDLADVDNLDLLDGKVKNDVLKRITTVAETIFREYEVLPNRRRILFDRKKECYLLHGFNSR